MPRRPDEVGAGAPFVLGRTLRLSFGALRTTGLWFVVFGGVVLAAEWAARRDAVRHVLVTPAVTTRLRPLDLKVAGIAEATRERGHIDCIIIGSSVAWTSLDPRELDAGLRAAGARPLQCYNFALPSLTVEEAAAVSEILVTDYHPGMLLYGFTSRDFRSTTLLNDPGRIVDLPWVRYRRGAPSLEGWLVTHSAAYRQALPYRLLLRPREWTAMRWHDERPSFDGYQPSGVVGALNGVALPVLAKGLATSDAGRPTTSALAALAELLDLRRAGVQVVLVEIPVSRTALRAFAPVLREYDSFAGGLRDRATAQGAWFVRRSGAFLGDEAFGDPIHMNPEGARRWSRWLGGRLAARTRPTPEGS